MNHEEQGDKNSDFGVRNVEEEKPDSHATDSADLDSHESASEPANSGGDAEEESAKFVHIVTGDSKEEGCSSNEQQDLKVEGEIIQLSDTGILNESLANEILHDRSDSISKSLWNRNKPSGKLAEIQAQIKSTMERAFWDGVVEELEKDPPDYSRVVQLVKELRDELDALVPQSWKQELHESIDIDLFAQILESGIQDIDYLSKLLDYAISIVIKLGAPARDDITKAAHEKLVEELSLIVASADKKCRFSFANALVKGLRFVLEQIQVIACSNIHGGMPKIDIQWNFIGNIVRLGLIQIVTRSVASTEKNTPETLRLNLERLLALQNDFQRVLVIATALLLVRQTLADKELALEDIESILNDARQKLSRMMESPLITVYHIGQKICQICSPYMNEGSVDAGLMTRVMNRSLTPGDGIFTKVSTAVMESIRVTLLAGKEHNGRGLAVAQACLKRIGATSVLELVTELTDNLDVIALVTCKVHGLWYENIKLHVNS
ncbi:T-complex protein [Nymphaea thermarum]|nr:T-complex protein [Nymphaea thermarum]